jgi:hypothetical protein
VYVGVVKVALLCPESHSLKEKRATVRRVKDRVVQRFGIAIAEVGALDSWQRAELGMAVAGSEREHVRALLDDVVGFVRGLAEIVDDRRDVFVYGDDAAGWRGGGDDEALALAAARTGAGDKAAALAGGDDWVPAAWREGDEP